MLGRSFKSGLQRCFGPDVRTHQFLDSCPDARCTAAMIFGTDVGGLNGRT